MLAAGWSWREQMLIGPGRVNLSGDQPYDAARSIRADYVLCDRGLPLAVLEAKAETESAASGMQQGSWHAQRLSLRFSFSTNGREWVVTDNATGQFETVTAPPAPADIAQRSGMQIDWRKWSEVFSSGYHGDQVASRAVRPYQEAAINKVLMTFAKGGNRALLVMAAGTGKTLTAFQLAWKLLNGKALERGHVLYLTDRNALLEQTFHAFAPLAKEGRVRVGADTVMRGGHLEGKFFFATYQALHADLGGRKTYEHYPPDSFDLVIVDECHRSAYGEWLGLLRYFNSARQLGLTAVDHGIENCNAQDYFGGPTYAYGLQQAIEEGYLAPYVVTKRTVPSDKDLEVARFIGEPVSRTNEARAIAEDFWELLRSQNRQAEKSIVFCRDIAHATTIARELQRVANDELYAALITTAEPNSRDLEMQFADVERNGPRVAVTVDLMMTGLDVPDVKNLVFARPVRSSVPYQLMRGRGTRLCEAAGKRFFNIIDYADATRFEEVKAANEIHPRAARRLQRELPDVVQPESPAILQDSHVAKVRDLILERAGDDIDKLFSLWIDGHTRNALRVALSDRHIYIQVLRYQFALPDTDEVDLLAKAAFDLERVPTRAERVERLWREGMDWLSVQLKEPGQISRARFWSIALDVYKQSGIDDLERARTYSAPQITDLFGSFKLLTDRYGGADLMRRHLELIKRRLYVRMN